MTGIGPKPVKVRINKTLAVDTKHGIVAGRIMETIAPPWPNQRNPLEIWVVGDAGEPVKLLARAGDYTVLVDRD